MSEQVCKHNCLRRLGGPMYEGKPPEYYCADWLFVSLNGQEWRKGCGARFTVSELGLITSKLGSQPEEVGKP